MVRFYPPLVSISRQATVSLPHSERHFPQEEHDDEHDMCETYCSGFASTEATGNPVMEEVGRWEGGKVGRVGRVGRVSR